MDLSVCITTYNLASVIDQTLESVFAQETEYSYEVLIGDDGSSDDTMTRILDWEGRYPGKIRHYQMPREQGKKYNPIFRASENRVNLLKHAEGTYITFLDGDDFYTDVHKFQKQIDILMKYSECSVCAHNMNLYFLDGSTRPMALASVVEGKINAKKYWAGGNYVHAEACIMRRKDLVMDTQFHRYFDDNFIVFLALQRGNMYYIPEEMGNYRQNATGFLTTEPIRTNIINMLDCDMEIRYNPSWKYASLKRHVFEYLFLRKNKEPNLSEKYCDLYKQAIEDNCKYVLALLNNDVSLTMDLQMFVCATWSYLCRVVRKIQKFLLKK